MTCVPIHDATLIGWGGDGARKLIRIKDLDMRIIIAGIQMGRVIMQIMHLARARTGPGDARLQLGIDPVPGDQRLDQRLGLFTKAPHRPGIIQAKHLLKRLLVLTLARAKLSAVAARGPESDALCLDQDNGQAGLGRVQGRGKAGVTAADDTDVGALFPLEHGEGPRGFGRRGIVACRVFAGAVVGMQQVHAGPPLREIRERSPPGIRRSATGVRVPKG